MTADTDHGHRADAAAADAGGDGSQRGHAEEGAFVSRVRLIEERPLEDRAAAFVQLHDELQRELEGQ